MSDRTVTSFSSSFNAETIAHALGGRKSGSGFLARCPAHEDHDPSLSLHETDGGKVLVHCFAGCSQEAVLDALRQRGLWPVKPLAHVSQDHSPPTAAVTRQPQPSQLWERYSPVSPGHPYLTRKRIGPHGARAVPGQSTLAIPLTDTEGAIHSLQYISADGTKRFLPHSAVKGHFFLVGDAREGGPLYIAEGFATAASIHKATGRQVATAFNAGNLVSVAKALRHQWPERDIVLCADDDASGLTKARMAARAAGAQVAVPDFGESRPKGATDFNDLFIHAGPEAVAGSIQRAASAPHALNELVEQSIADPGYVFRPDVLEQLRALKRADRSEYEAVRARLKQKAKCRVTPLDKLIDRASKNDGDNGKASLADQLVALAREALHDWEDVFVSVQDSSFKEAFADLTEDGRRETWPVSGGSFKEWLTVKFFEKTGRTPGSEALRSAVHLIKSEASRGGRKRPVFVRCGAYGGKLYLDLCDEAWRIVEISKDGWQVAESDALGPIRFCRYPEMKLLPEPQKNGAINALREFVNIKSGDGFILLVSWLLAALRNTRPYPVLVLSGEQGSAKSTVVRILRSLVDPSQIPMRLFPRQDIDLFIAARHNHVLAFDNLSYLSPGISDTLCQLATGGGLGTRRLYTDEDELLISASCPIILNGIENVAARADLADRSVFIELEPIPERDRRLESELWARFEAKRPRILGALLDAMAVGLRRFPDIWLMEKPRMADFAQWAMACETAFWPEGAFLSVYRENRQAAMEEMVANDAVAHSICILLQQSSPWEGTSSELLLALGGIAGEQTVKSKRWPGNANVLSKLSQRSEDVVLVATGKTVDEDFSVAGQRATQPSPVFRPPSAWARVSAVRRDAVESDMACLR